MNDTLDTLRAELDEADRELVRALAARLSLVRRTAELKSLTRHEIRDALREEEILARRGDDGERAGLPRYFVTALFREILDASVRFQGHAVLDHQNGREEAPAVVAYQGVAGAYSEVAARAHFEGRRGSREYRGYPGFREMLEAVERGEASWALLPIENTTAGSINEAYDLLARSGLSIVGEEVLRVEHCLLAPAPARLEEIHTVLSHPQALAQCTDFLAGLAGCRVESWGDTALAARRVAEDGDPGVAAIASEAAGRLYGLTVIARDLANQEANFTRFVVVARTPVAVDPRVPAKTSLVFSLPHRRGALVHALGTLAEHDLNLTKIESRPRPNTPWQYRFYADVEGNLAEPRVAEALQELAARTRELRVLGCYPARVAFAAAGGPSPEPTDRRNGTSSTQNASESTVARANRTA